MFSIVGFRFWIWFGMAMPLIFFLPQGISQVLSLSAVDSSLVRLSFKQLEPAINPIQPTVAGVIVSHQFVMAQSHTNLLESQLNKLDTSGAQAHVGIGVLDLNTGESWFQNGLQRFPMQSVFKLPLSIVVLKLVDSGKLSLSQLVTISSQDFAGYSPILKEIKGNSAQFTVRDLLERSIGMSDNTAADALARLVGGPQKVTAILHQMNLRGIRVDRLEQQLQPDCVGLKNFRPELAPELANEQRYKEAVDKIPVRVKQAALETYLTDPRDTATPEDMVALLAKLQSHQLLSEKSKALLLKIMTDSSTGQHRLKAGLPPGWSIAHKTGTGPEVLGIGTATNDVGIISSPTGRHIALAVFIAGSKAPVASREKVMESIASAVVKAIQ